MSEPVHVSADDAAVSTFLGLENRVALGPEHTGGALSVIDVTVQPGSGSPMHTNTREDLTFLVLDGTLTLHTAGGDQDLGAGSASFVPRDVTHTFMNRSDRPARFVLVCTPGGFEGFLLDLAGKLPETAPEGPPPEPAVQMLVETASRFGVTIHPEGPPG